MSNPHGVPTKAQRRAQRRKQAKLSNQASNKQKKTPPHPKVQEGMLIAKRQVREKVLGGRYGNIPYDVSNLLHQFSLPGDVPEYVRIPTPDMPKTAILRAHQTEQMILPATALEPFWVAFYGQPSLMYAYEEMGSVNTSTLYFSDNSTQFSIDVKDNINIAQIVTDATNRWFPFTGQIQAGGPKIPIFVNNGLSYIYIDHGRTVTLTVSQTVYTPGDVAAGGMAKIAVYRYQGPSLPDTFCGNHEFALGTGVAPPATVTTQIAFDGNLRRVNGWYAFKWEQVLDGSEVVVPDSTASIQITMTLDAFNGKYMKMVTMEGLYENSDVGKEVRRTACSLLMSNTSAAINKQGSVVAGRQLRSLPGAGLGHTVGSWSNSVITGTSRAIDFYSGNAEKGLYTYLSFDECDESFLEAVNAYGYPIIGPWISSGYMNVATFKLADAQSFNWTVDTIYEFKTQKQMFDIRVPHLKFDTLVEVRRINNNTKYFFCNPIHWGSIGRYLREAWAALRQHSTKIGLAVSALNPGAAPIVMPIARALQT